MTERLSLRIPCDRSAVAGLVEAVGRFLAGRPLPPDLLPNISVVLDEVVSNIASHAHPGGGGGERAIDVDVEFRAGELRVTVSDDGVAFDPTRAAAPDTSLGIDERAVGGLGLLLVTRLMDSVAYERSDGRNRLRLTKALPGARRPQGG